VEAVADAREPCPQCGKRRWLADGTERLACAACGFEEPYPRMFRIYKATPEETLKAAKREFAARAAHRATLDALTIPVYALIRRRPHLSGPPAADAVAVTAAFDDGRMLVVATMARDSAMDAERLARRALGWTAVGDGVWQLERSHAGLAVWLNARDRRRRAEVARLRLRRTRMRVEGKERDFALVRSRGWWSAALADDEVGLTVTAQAMEPRDVALRRLDDPVAALLDR
jgi:ribosomal protein S27AE